MKRFLIFALCMSGVFFIEESTAQTLTESLKKKVAMYLTAIYYSDSPAEFLKADDLNTRYWIYDILDQKKLDRQKSKAENGKIYIFRLLGDDQCGTYAFIENNKIQIMDMYTAEDYRAACDFMCRHHYRIEQVNTVLKYMIENDEYESYFSLPYADLSEEHKARLDSIKRAITDL